MATLTGQQIKELVHSLKQEVANLNILVEQLEELLPDPDEGLEIKPEVKAKLIELQKTPRERLLTLREIRKKLMV